MNSATAHLSLHACPRRLGTNASRFRRLQFIYYQPFLGTRRVPYLAGKKLTLAWVAASAADEAAITALIPTPPPGQQLDPSQLPRGLGSSIHLKPELRLDGTPVASGPGMGAGSEPVGQGGYTRYGQQDWDETQDPLIAGQQTAIGLSIQGISQAQLQTLKTRMEATQQKLQQAQAAPEAQRPTILQGMTGEHLTGDLLTATIWGYFVALQSHGSIAASQTQMIDRPALSYGLFHAQVKPRKLYGIVTTGITFQGLNMDIGHLRHTRWVKNDDPSAPINNKPELTANGKPAAQNRWIAYNKMRGQYSSAMEHAVPEQFWVDQTTCSYTDERGQVRNPVLPRCPEAVSAVKAIAIAQSEGQKIYAITQLNAATALPTLPVGGDVGAEIRNAIAAGKEVAVHQGAINKFGWNGYGYIIIDPDTGGGAYLIEGKGNGGEMSETELNTVSFAMGSSIVVYILVMISGLPFLPVLIFGILMIQSLRMFIAEINETLENKPMNDQRETYISAISFIFFISNLIKLGVASGNPALQIMGWMTSILNAVFSALKDRLLILWPNRG